MTVKELLKERDIPVIPNPSHIIPIFVGDAEKTTKAAEMLLEKFGIYIATVKLLRVTPGAVHTQENCHHLANALDAVWNKFEMKRGHQWDPTGLRFENNLNPIWTSKQLNDVAQSL